MNLSMPKTLIILIACSLVLAGCALSGPPGPATQAPLPVATSTPGRAVTQPVEQPTEVPTQTPPATAVPTTSPAADAKKAAQDYAAALEAQDFSGASKMISNFSLTNAQMTAGDAAGALSSQQSIDGKRSAFQVKDAQLVSPKTALVQVSYQLTAKDPKTGKETQTAQDELWPMRLENGAWRYNWGNVIDNKTLDVKEATYAGMTVKPVQMTRYSDRIDLTLLVQNATNEAIVWGSPSETIATFHFGDKAVVAEKNRLIFDTLRSYPDTVISLKGLYEEYPDSVELRKFPNAKAPWFNFQLTE